MRWSLELNSGARVILGRGVTTIGRSPRCDIVLPDPSISRRQLLVSARRDAVELINVGKHPASVDGQPVVEAALAGDGARVEIADVTLATVRRVASPAEDAGARWFVRVDDGPMLALSGERFTIGGGQDDLIIASWAAATLALHVVDGSVVVEAAQGASASPRLDADGFGRLSSGESLEYAGVRVEVVSAGGSELEESTVQRARAQTSVRLEALRRGGMLVIEGCPGATSVFLHRRRCALLRALLSPPPDAPGGYCSVDALCRQIWPEDPVKDETDFNVLLHRVRQDLLRAGIDVCEWIERARGSGMVRAPIVARPDVSIQLE